MFRWRHARLRQIARERAEERESRRDMEAAARLVDRLADDYAASALTDRTVAGARCFAIAAATARGIAAALRERATASPPLRSGR